MAGVLVGPLVAADGAALQAVGARDPARARAFADAWGAPSAYGSYDEVLADPAVDAVYVALPNDAHEPWTTAALTAGKAVLCEKPLALVRARGRGDGRRRAAFGSAAGRGIDVPLAPADPAGAGD